MPRALVLLLPVVALLALAPSPSLGDGPGKPAEPEWSKDRTESLVALSRTWLEVADNDRRKKDSLLEDARKLGRISGREIDRVVKELFKVARSGPKSDGKGECVAKFPPFPGKYYLSGTGGGRKGIFVGLHGGGPGVGDGRSAQGQWGGATGKGLIGVFPTANLPDRKTTWQSAEVERFVIAVILELKRTFRIDTNRVYIAGHSLGGSGAFHIGPHHADWFVGVSPNAGGCHGVGAVRRDLPGGYLANLFNSRMFITHFDQDPRVDVLDSRAAARDLAELRKEHPDGYEYRYIEGHGVSHGFPPGGNPGKIISWLTQKKRDPYPKKVIWEPTVPTKRLFYWLRVARPIPGWGASRIVARIDKNRVEVTSGLRKGLSILLADEMISESRPVTVVLNGKTVYEDYPLRDPAAVLESVMENIDREQVFTRRIDLGD